MNSLFEVLLRWGYGQNFIINRVIDQIKGEIKLANAEYSSVVPYILGWIYSALLTKIPTVSKSSNPLHASFLSSIAELAFFFFQTDLRVNTSNKTARIVLSILSKLKQDSQPFKRISREIQGCCVQALDSAVARNLDHCEISSILVLLFHLDSDNPIDDELLRQILFENSSESSDYIRITTALWCCRKNPKYLATYQAAVRAIERIAQQFDELSLARCEIVMLLFDIVSCPYLDKDTKENFVMSLIVATSESKKSEVSSRSTVTQTISYIEANLGFCEWQEFDRLGGLLRRRELRTVYE